MSKRKLYKYQKKIQVNNTYGVSRVKVIKKKTPTRHKKVKRQIDYKKLKATYDKGLVSSIHKEPCFTNL